MRRGLVGLSLATGGCLVLNPSYDGDGGSGEFASASGRPTSDAGASSSGASGDTGGTGGTATGGESTGFDTTGAVATTGSTGDDDTTGTTAIEPGVAVIPADIATCVLQPLVDLPYQGPEQCEFLVTVELAQDPAQKDGLIVDRQFDDAQGRPAWGVLRFELAQAVPNGATITAASLALTVSASPYQNFPIAASGRLRPTEPFDTATLAVGPPVVGVGEVPIGPTNPGELKVLDVAALVVQGTAAVHLAIEPEDPSGRIYMNKASDAPPTLTVTWQ